MFKQPNRKAENSKRHLRIRSRVQGTTERPRLSVYRSLNHIYAQIIDDTKGVTLVAASTMEDAVKGQLDSCGNVEGAKVVGKTVAEKAINQGIKKVVFDRGGHVYHGRIKALAEAAREAGLEF